MGIYIKGRYVADIYINKRPVLAVYIKNRKSWPKFSIIASCFSNGYWIDLYPWTDDKPWVD